MAEADLLKALSLFFFFLMGKGELCTGYQHLILMNFSSKYAEQTTLLLEGQLCSLLNAFTQSCFLSSSVENLNKIQSWIVVINACIIFCSFITKTGTLTAVHLVLELQEKLLSLVGLVPIVLQLGETHGCAILCLSLWQQNKVSKQNDC